MSRWYIIHAYSGFENKVRESILSEAKRLNLEGLVESVEVPTEKVTEVRRGKKVTSDRKFFPGYVLAKLAMNDDVYHLVKNTPKVTGFLGSGGKPQPISEAEAARILNTKEEALSAAPSPPARTPPRVTAFLGSGGKPQPISEAEAARILNTKEEALSAAPKTKISVDYEIGDQVKAPD